MILTICISGIVGFLLGCWAWYKMNYTPPDYDDARWVRMEDEQYAWFKKVKSERELIDPFPEAKVDYGGIKYLSELHDLTLDFANATNQTIEEAQKKIRKYCKGNRSALKPYGIYYGDILDQLRKFKARN